MILSSTKQYEFSKNMLTFQNKMVKSRPVWRSMKYTLQVVQHAMKIL